MAEEDEDTAVNPSEDIVATCCDSLVLGVSF